MPKKTQELHLRTKGVLPIQKLKILAQSGVISSDAAHPILEDQYQPNSIDLRLGELAYRVRSSFYRRMRPLSKS